MTDPSQPTPQTSRLCTATSADGSPCRAWAVRGSHPPRCAPHGGGAAPVGAPTGNQNARTHGFYARTRLPSTGRTSGTGPATAAVIAKLCIKHLRITRHIDQHKHELPIPELAHLCHLYSTNFSRLVSAVANHYGALSPADFKALFARLLRQHSPDTEQTT